MEDVDGFRLYDTPSTWLLPRLVEALVGKKMIGAAAGQHHTAVLTDDGEVFTFGNGESGKLGHGGQESEAVQRLLGALV